MGKLLDEINAYLNSASKQQIDSDWERFKEFNESGPEMLCLLDESAQYIHDSICNKGIKFENLHKNSGQYGGDELYLAA